MNLGLSETGRQVNELHLTIRQDDFHSSVHKNSHQKMFLSVNPLEHLKYDQEAK